MDAESLRRALAANPGDVGAAIQLARLLARTDNTAEAHTLLTALERRLCPDPLTGLKAASEALAHVRTARFELDYRFEQTRCREWLSWPPQTAASSKGLAHLWNLSSEAGWVWRTASLCADRRQVFAHKAAASAYPKARLHAIDLRTGQVQWTQERDATLGDARFWGHDALLVCWWTQQGTELELLDRAKGTTLNRLTITQPCQRRTLLGLGEQVGLVSGVLERGAQLGVVDVQRMAVRWEPLGSLSTAELVLAYTRRNHAIDGSGHALISRLELPFEPMALWRETHGDEHLIYGWLVQHLGREEARLHGRLWRIREGRVQAIALPERWRHEPVVPRFYRVGSAWVGTLQGYRLRVEHGARGPQVTPLGPVTAAQPDVWRLGDDEAQAQALPLGHPGAHDSVIAGGVWWQVRTAPTRLSAYLTPGKGLTKQLLTQPIPTLSAEMSASRGEGWDRPEALAELHVVPLGPSLLQISPTALACRQLG